MTVPMVSTVAQIETKIRCSIILPGGDDLSKLNTYLLYLSESKLPEDYELIIINDCGLEINEKRLRASLLAIKVVNADGFLSQERLFNKASMIARGEFLLFVRSFIEFDKQVLEESINDLAASGEKMSVSANKNFVLAKRPFYIEAGGFERPDSTYKVSQDTVERIVKDEANPLYRIACVVENNSKVLDVGAGNGVLGLVLVKLHKNVVIDAVEPNKAGAGEIRSPYRQVHHGYLNDYMDELIKEKYDYIILADVIEHLSDPSELIKNCIQLLSDDGKLIISVPNIAFGSVRLSLLQGRFDYTDSGLLERTHLRFYTLNSLLPLMSKLNLACSEIAYLKRNFSSAGPKINILEFDCSTLETVTNDPTSHIYQFILVLQRNYKKKPITKSYGSAFQLNYHSFRHMKKQMPKVSILIPTFNRADYLKMAIDSAVNQTYPNVEILVLDDCSTDDTVSLLKAYSNIKNVTFIRNERNIGFIKNWNKAVSLSSGEYIKIMGDDDILENNCIAEQVKILNECPDVGVVCCNYHIIDENGNIKNNNNPYRLFNKDTKENGEEFIKNYLCGKRPVGWPTSILFRKEDFEKAGIFDADVGSAADIDMWCRILRSKNFYYLDQTLAYCRQWSGNLSKKLSKTGINHFHTKTVQYIKQGQAKRKCL